MKRACLIALVVLALPVSVRAACTGSSPRWASSADYTSLNSCVAGATVGDTIVVTGNATWTSTLTLTRGVHLVGSGNPTLTGKVLFLWWKPSAEALAAHDVLTVRGFTFDGDNSSAAEVGSLGLITLGWQTGTNYFTAILLDNTFKNTQGRAVYTYGRVHGVAARNTFENVYIPLGLYGGNQYSWDTDTQSFGDANQFYFEDNLIQYVSWAGSTRAVSGGNAGQGVIRYNDWNMDTDAASGSQLWELHGLQSMYRSDGVTRCTPESGDETCDPTVAQCDSYSALSSEWYGNDTYGIPTGNQWMQHRGGWMLFHHNFYSATSGANTGIQFQEYACDSCQKYTAYGPFTMHVANTYVWNNFDNTTRTGMTKSFDYCADNTIGDGPYTITEDVDYWTDKYATFNGTSGTGCGTLGARPATCTTGVAYWATTQSCTSLTGLIGRSPTTPISGTLYKCTAPNTWTSYYTPYTYPHPLATAPAAAGNVRVQ